MAFMKVLIFALALTCVAGQRMSAEDFEIQTQRIVDDVIIIVINDISQTLRDRGLDPYYNPGVGGELDIAGLLTAGFQVTDIRFTGISNIAVNHLTYGLYDGVLDMDIGLPAIHASVESASATLVVSILDLDLRIEAAASITVRNFRVIASARVVIDEDGIGVDNFRIELDLDGIDSAIKLILQDEEDMGPSITETLDSVVGYLELYRIQLSDFLSYYGQLLINRFLL